VLSGRDGRDARAPLATCQLAHQIVSQLSPRRDSVAVPEMAECFAWSRLRFLPSRRESLHVFGEDVEFKVDQIPGFEVAKVGLL
jgi:hypothetical protein